jgi:hypothetical protein
LIIDRRDNQSIIIIKIIIMATPNNLFEKAPLSKSKGAVRNLTQ